MTMRRDTDRWALLSAYADDALPAAIRSGDPRPRRWLHTCNGIQPRPNVRRGLGAGAAFVTSGGGAGSTPMLSRPMTGTGSCGSTTTSGLLRGGGAGRGAFTLRAGSEGANGE